MGNQSFAEILMEGGHRNSLGRVSEVIELVLNDKSRLEELYECWSAEDAWVRMRAADATEKICRVRPAWIEPYINKFIDEFSDHPQASIQWHLAQIYRQTDLTTYQKMTVINWLVNILSSPDIDWIVSANCMDTIRKFYDDNALPRTTLMRLLKIQLKHKSPAVVKRAYKHIEAI